MAAKTVLMTLNRDKTIASTLGHMITFTKDEPLPVPEVMVRTCAEYGAVRADGEDAIKEEVDETPAQPIDPGHRLEDVSKALETIVERNDSNDFTAAGIPNVKVVTKEVGYRVDRTEVIKAWKARAEEE